MSRTLLLCVEFLATTVQAGELKFARELLESSGLTLMIQSTPEVVLGESEAALSRCQAHRTEWPGLVALALNSEQMLERAERHVQDSLSAEHRRDIKAWLATSAAQAMARAERVPTQESDGVYFDSDAWDDARRQRIVSVNRASGVDAITVAHFLGIDALVAAISACDLDAKARATVQQQQHAHRASGALYAALFSSQLIEPSALVYRTLSDDVLDEAIEFARSDAGQAYREVLRSALLAALNGAEQQFYTAYAADDSKVTAEDQ